MVGLCSHLADVPSTSCCEVMVTTLPNERRRPQTMVMTRPGLNQALPHLHFVLDPLVK